VEVEYLLNLSGQMPCEYASGETVMDSVSIAFDLMRMELEAEIENLNSEGARLFRDSEYYSAKKLSEKGVRLADFCSKVEALSEEWVDHFQEEFPKARNEQELAETHRKILSASKAPQTGLLVMFTDGTVIAESKASTTLVGVIKKIGFERVAALHIMVNGENIVSNQPSNKNYSETNLGGYYIKTHSSTAQKKKNVEQISKELGLNLQVSIID